MYCSVDADDPDRYALTRFSFKRVGDRRRREPGPDLDACHFTVDFGNEAAVELRALALENVGEDG